MTQDEAIVFLCEGQQEVAITVCIGGTTVRHVVDAHRFAAESSPRDQMFVEFDGVLEHMTAIAYNKDTVSA